MQVGNQLSRENRAKSENYYLLGLAALCALIFFYGLGRLPLIGPDEPRYAQVAREMFATGDWITPTLGGIHWFEKPALTYWLSAAGYRIFGVNEFGARFFVAVFAAIGVFALYFFGKRLRSARYGYLCASALATCGLWPGFARGATFDLPLAASIELSLLSFFVWERGEERKEKRVYWLLFAFSLGLGVLAKGLIGVVLPGIVIGLYLLLTRRLKVFFKPANLLIGASIFIATAATWYGPVIARHGQEFINEFFIAHHFQRYLSNKFRHPQPFYFFFFVAFAGSFPWSFFLASNAWRSVKSWRREGIIPSDRLQLFLWVWALTPIVFFSFSGSKLPGYILPAFPAIGMIIGRELERWWSDDEAKGMTWLAAATVLLIFAAGLALGLGGERSLGVNLFDSFRAGTIAIMAAVAYLAIWFFISGRAATIFLPFGLALAVVTFVNIMFPALGRAESLRDLSLAALQNARPGERLVFYVNHDHGINFYAAELPLRDERSELVTVVSPEAILELIEANGGRSILVISPRRWSAGVGNHEGVGVEQIAEQKGNPGCSPECDWVLLRSVRRDLSRTVQMKRERMPPRLFQ